MDLTTVGTVIVVMGGILFIGFLLKQINPSWSSNRSSNTQWNSPSWFSSNSQTYQSSDQADTALGQQWDSTSGSDSDNFSSSDSGSSCDQSASSDSGSTSSCDCSPSGSGSSDCGSSDSGSSADSGS